MNLDKATNDYVSAVEAVDQLFLSRRSQGVLYDEFAVLRRDEIEKTLRYAEALIECGHTPPAGLADAAYSSAKHFFSEAEIDELLTSFQYWRPSKH